MHSRPIDQRKVRHHKLVNILQSTLIILSMCLVLGLLGYALGGVTMMLVIVIVGVLPLLMLPQVSGRIMLQLYRARPIREFELTELHQINSLLSRNAQLPVMPALYYVPSMVANAFSVGTKRSPAIVITDGLLRNLNLREIIGVLAHEISHIENNDMWVMGLADLVSRLTSLLTSLGQLLLLISLPLVLVTDASMPWLLILILIIAPLLVNLLQLALSRVREYHADTEAVNISGDARGLASALLKLENQQAGWLQILFFPGRKNPHPSILRTHPPTNQRIKRLLALEHGVESERNVAGLFPSARILHRPPQAPHQLPRRRLFDIWH